MNDWHFKAVKLEEHEDCFNWGILDVRSNTLRSSVYVGQF